MGMLLLTLSVDVKIKHGNPGSVHGRYKYPIHVVAAIGTIITTIIRVESGVEVSRSKFICQT